MRIMYYLYHSIKINPIMKRIIFITIICSLTLILNVGCGSKSNKEHSTEATSISEQQREPAKSKFVKLAEKTNKNMPMPMPGGIRMDKAEALSKTEFKYYYTFTKAPIVSAEEFERSTKPALTLGMQNAKGEDLDMFKKEKMNLIYAYYTMDGKLFAEIRLAPEDYTNK